MKSATRSDWKTLDLPEQRATIELDLRFTPDEFEQIKRGVIPEEMEDKWFVYWGDDSLFFHRSWTGFCVHIVRFVLDDDGATAVEADLNRDSEQYKNTDDRYDARMIPYLIDVVLLRQPSRYPSKSSSDTRRALEQWSQVGHAGLGIHPGDKREPLFKIKSRCFLCKHKFGGHKGCAAFPEGLPHKLASGEVMHDEPFPGDKGYRFEERKLGEPVECDPTYKGRDLRIPVEKILELAPRCDFETDHSAHLSYQHFVEYFNELEEVTPHHVVIATSFTFSWMPMCLEFRKPYQLETVAALLCAVRKKNYLDCQNLTNMKRVANNSMIGVSKLLHFANPDLYAIVNNRVATFLKTEGQIAEPTDPQWYVAYTCAMKTASHHDKSGAVRWFVSDAVGYPVSTLRALELVMFLSTKELLSGSRCPRCGAVGVVVPIIYGYPGSGLAEKSRRGDVHLGGCCIDSESPHLHCKECGYEW